MESVAVSETTWGVKIANGGSGRTWTYNLVIGCANAN